jgi:hypothetical protein
MFQVAETGDSVSVLLEGLGNIVENGEIREDQRPNLTGTGRGPGPLPLLCLHLTSYTS